MKDPDRCDVLLVGYEDFENLGLRYIASFLTAHGIVASIEPCDKHAKQRICARIARENPTLVGFSLIYQGMLSDFATLISYLRMCEINAHFTIGGHFPTIEPKVTLELIPGLDTVVRHEGEITILELFKHLDDPRAWSKIAGIAYRKNGAITVTAPRPLIKNLDSLSFPTRPEPLPTWRGLGMCSMLTSRGCYYDCSFCSIKEFYGEPPGPTRRSRSPANVAREMKQLFERGVRIFRFNDDDFGMKSRSQQRWIETFASELERNGLAEHILWRISCRVDEVDAEPLQRLKEVGLRFLYLGIESGCNEGLRTGNKHCDVADAYSALDVLEDVGVGFEYGFMLFDPDSSFASVNADIEFLRRLARGGRVVVHFAKMYPYAGTSIARRLKAEGRLRGTVEIPGYTYTDPRIDLLDAFIFDTFYPMIFEERGLVNTLQVAHFDVAVCTKFFPDNHDVSTYADSVRRLTNTLNDSLLETVRLATTFMEKRSYEDIVVQWDALRELKAQDLAIQHKIAAELDLLKLA